MLGRAVKQLISSTFVSEDTINTSNIVNITRAV